MNFLLLVFHYGKIIRITSHNLQDIKKQALNIAGVATTLYSEIRRDKKSEGSGTIDRSKFGELSGINSKGKL